jgi:outer membrane protein assembly factor BamA
VIRDVGHLVRLALVLAALAPVPARAQAPLVVEEVRVHGNHSTPDDEVLRIAALSAGATLETGAVDAARDRLVKSGRFTSVEIRQRSRSIDDPSRVALVILVAELASVRPAIDVGVPPIPGPWARLRSQAMFLPILSIDDGYGFTYGVRTSLVGGKRSATRVSIPASWGGTRQLAIEADHTFTRVRSTAGDVAARDSGLVSRGLTRVRGAAGLWRQEHPFYEQGQFRQYVDGEISWRPRPLIGLGATAGTAAVAFGEVDDQMTSGGVFAELDTRRDPLFPRNAVYARSAWQRVAFAHPERSGVPEGSRGRWRHDVRGYLGTFGQLVIAARLQAELSDGPLPAYAKPILGGADTLRGVRAGYAVGDNQWAGTVEARLPLTSVLRQARFGLLGFYDTGATWDHGQRWRDADRIEGVGGGLFIVTPVFQFQLSVARGLGLGTRVHASTGVAF